MRLRKIALIALCMVTCFLSCNKDDDTEEIVVEIRNRAEQQVTDKDSLIDYLETHYYNSNEFESITNPTIKDLIFTKLEDEETVPDGSTLLIDAAKLETKTVVFADTEYEYYILKLQQGGGSESPEFADDVVVEYEGFTLDDAVFDSTASPVIFDLVVNVALSGWRRVFPQFNVAESFVENGDGTVSYTNQGLGVMFLPSGLGYFSDSTSGIASYSPLIFKFELLQMAQNDHDGDGIPSYLEDLNEDGEFTLNTDVDTNDGDDTDDDGLPNYFDSDDDGDGILTEDEITVTTENRATIEELKAITLESNQELLNAIVKEENGTFTGTIITFTDSDGDNIADYLDAE